MSLYVRHPEAAPARIEVYPKRRRSLSIGALATRDVSYADFFVDVVTQIA